MYIAITDNTTNHLGSVEMIRSYIIILPEAFVYGSGSVVKYLLFSFRFNNFLYPFDSNYHCP